MRYPGAVCDPDTGDWISDAEVAEIPYTAFASTNDAITARLIVRRVKDARHLDALFPVWRYHPFFTNTDLPVAEADVTHRRHAIIETVFADLIDGPLAHMPSGRFGANSAWVLCAGDRAQPAARRRNTGRPNPRRRTRSHPAPKDRQRRGPVGSPATPTRPATYPSHWPLGERMANPVAQHHRPTPTATARDGLTTRRKARPEPTGKTGQTSGPATSTISDPPPKISSPRDVNPIHGSRFTAAGGPPLVVRMDNGPELIPQALQRFCVHGVGLSYIAPGAPWNNGDIESFNDRPRNERLSRDHWETPCFDAGRGDRRRQGRPPPHTTPAYGLGLPDAGPSRRRAGSHDPPRHGLRIN